MDRSDVREVDSAKFYGIAPGKRVGLKYSYIVKITGIQKEGDKIVKVTAEIDTDVTSIISQKSKPKSFLHWLSIEEAHPCTVNMYGPLFKCHDPNAADDYLSELNPNSLVVYKDAKMNRSILPDLKILSR